MYGICLDIGRIHISKTALETGTLLKQEDRGVKVVFETSGILFSSQKSQLRNVVRPCKGRISV